MAKSNSTKKYLESTLQSVIDTIITKELDPKGAFLVNTCAFFKLR